MASRLPHSSEEEGERWDYHPTDPPSISPSTGLKVGGSVRVIGRGRGRGRGRGIARKPGTVPPRKVGHQAKDLPITSPTTSPPTDPPTTSPPTDPPAISLPTDPPTKCPATVKPTSHATGPLATPPTDPPTHSPSTDPPATSTSTDPQVGGSEGMTAAVTHVQTEMTTEEDSSESTRASKSPRVLKGSDLPALMTVLGDSAYCAYQLGLQIGLPPELVRTLKDKAQNDPTQLLTLVLENQLQRTSHPLTLQTLVEAISKSPINNQSLALELLEYFKSDGGPEQPLMNPSGVPLSPAMAAYSEFLDSVYQVAAPSDPKGGPEPSSTYTNLTVIKKEKMSRADADKFTKATLHGGIEEIMRVKKPIELKDVFKPEEGQANVNFVLAEGATGVGKSTMAMELCRRRHKIGVTKAFAAVVLLRLCEKEVQEVKSVADLLYHDDPKIKEAVVEEICSTSGEDILFVLDGFDEVPHEIRKSMFVAKIISGQCLPKATILVTSRPSARADLLSLRKPDKHIEVLGFTHKLIEEYASGIFGYNTPLLADFLKYVPTNPALKSMMYIPLNCAIVVEIYQENREEGRPIPQTMTQLFSELTLSRISRHLSEGGGHLVTLPETLEDLAPKHPEIHRQLHSLAKLAFNGTLKQEVLFEELPAGCSTLGLMTASQRLYGRRGSSTNYSFFHLSMQEFLSAYYISQLSSSEQKKAFEEYSDKQKSKEKKFSHMDLVWRFLAGLTGFISIGWDLVHSTKGTTRCHGVSSFFIECLYEAQQKVQCELILGQRSELSFASDSAFASFACGYCVAVSQSTWDVQLQPPPEALEMFVYGLTSQEEVHGSIGRLSLSFNPIGQEGIARLKDIPHKLLQQLSVLELRHCELDGSALDQLSDVIPSMTSLNALDIYANEAAGDGGTVKLLQTLQVAAASHLHTLDMVHVPIGRDDIMALSHLMSPSGRLKKLSIGDKHMQYDCMELLLKVVFSPSSLQTLTLCYMRIDTTSLSFTPLKGNCNITTLEIHNCTIGSRDISCIAEVLCTNTTLERLRIGEDHIGVTIESNPSQVTGAVGNLADSLKVNRSLKELYLALHSPDEYRAVRTDEAQALIDTLQYNQTLELLTLCRCRKYFSYDERNAMDSRVKLPHEYKTMRDIRRPRT